MPFLFLTTMTTLTMTIWSAAVESYRLAQFCCLSLSHLKRRDGLCYDVRSGLWLLRYSLSLTAVNTTMGLVLLVQCFLLLNTRLLVDMTRLGGLQSLHLRLSVCLSLEELVML